MKNKKNFINNSNNAITLISLVITIVVLIILASVAIYLSLGNNGIFTRAKQARELTNKQEATEIINLKITTAQINKYAEKQEMPTLKELSLVLKEDNEIQYITDESKEATTEYEVGENPSSIFIKLKKYSYEFEITDDIKIAKIDGENVEIGKTDNLGIDYTTNLKYKLNLSEDLSSQPGITINGNGVTLSNDKKYVSFDGTSYININNDTVDPTSSLRSQSDVTMCAWYRTSKISGEHIIIALGEDGATGVYNKHYMSFFPGGLIGAVQGWDTVSTRLQIANSTNGNWHFIASVWKNNSTVVFYYDGVPFEAIGSYSTSNSYLDIGGSKDNGYNFTGDISDIRIYDKALTEYEVKRIYEYGKKYLGI